MMSTVNGTVSTTIWSGMPVTTSFSTLIMSMMTTPVATAPSGSTTVTTSLSCSMPDSLGYSMVTTLESSSKVANGLSTVITSSDLGLSTSE
ncbi:MAG: hypothetical protein JSW25_08275 [Thermoplasmata archaeon]|nr:MAG: hypothetical protein JSW25_08275 [Thermoplasmata archaeon]